MDEPQVVNRLDRQDALGHVELGHVLRKRVVLYEPAFQLPTLRPLPCGHRVNVNSHGHQITARQEFHDEVQVLRILERVVQLHDPRRIALGEHIALGSDVRQLWGSACCLWQVSITPRPAPPRPRPL